MIFIPLGSFRFQEVGMLKHEGFYMDETPVTVDQYREAVKAGACTPPKDILRSNWSIHGRENHPINCLDWNQACAYAKWAGKRLPSITEWGWAAGGGDEVRTYPWGDDEPTNQLCWNGEGNELGIGNRRSTSPVGSYPRGNSLHGLKDMAGNVREWTNSTTIKGDIMVGGCGFIETNPIYCENYSFTRCSYTKCSTDIGFRCVRPV